MVRMTKTHGDSIPATFQHLGISRKAGIDRQVVCFQSGPARLPLPKKLSNVVKWCLDAREGEGAAKPE
jgi:hypothetical protein